MTVTRTRLFMLMVWKNLKLLASKPASTFFRIALPIVLALLLVVAKYHKPKAHHQATFPPYCAIHNHPERCTINTTVFNYKYKPPSILDMLDFKKNRLVYCPSDNPMVNKAMKAMEKYFLEVLGFENCDAFQEEVSQKVVGDGSSVMAGLEFHISEPGPKQASLLVQTPDHISLKLRFTSLLAQSEKGTRTWMTNKLRILPKHVLPGPRTKGLRIGEYTRHGFVTIMGLATYELVKAVNASFEFPEVHLRKFPYPSWTNEMKRWLVHMLLVLMTGAAFFLQYISVLRSFLKEKETQVRLAMKVMGVPHHLHWTTKFTTGYFFSVVLSAATSAFLALRWFPVKDIVSANQTRTVYKTLMMETSPSVIFVFLMAYAAAVITFGFAVATLFSSSIRGQIVSTLVFLLGFMPFVLLTVSEEDTPVYKQLLSCVCVNSAMGLGWTAILNWEYVGVGATFDNFWSTSHGKSCPLGYIVLMLLFDTVWHMVFITYFIGVFPDDGSPAKSVYFLFTKKFWCQNRVPVERSRTSSLLQPRWEIVAGSNEPERLISVDIINLRKIYGGNIVAVKNLNMRIYEGRVTVIIGQKDAGKSTIMRMLAGITPPTSGTATIYGHDLHSDFGKVRHKLGFCSHSNIMYESLSIEDNLKFFAMMRGASRAEALQDTAYYIKLLELGGERKKSPKRLSPEVRRKLSIALAFCGDAKLIFLEEPTFGLKYVGKRAVWDVINLLKRNRTVIVNTLFIDEAEALGDHIAIVAAGEVLCYGSLASLKNKYGVGYFLHVRVTPTVDLSNLNRMMKFYVPRLADPEILLNDEGEVNVLHYTLSKNDSSRFSGMLADLEGLNGQVLGVKGFSVNVVSLGEVFLKIITQQHHKTKQQDEITEHQWRAWRSRIQHRKPLHLTKGCRLILNHILAMLMKRILIYSRNKMSFVFMLMTIVFILWFAMSEVVAHRPFTVLPSLELVTRSDVTLLETLKDPLLSKPQDDVAAKITKSARFLLSVRMVDSVLDTIVKERAENNLKFNDLGITNAITFETPPDDKTINLISWYTEDVFHAEGEAAAKGFALIYHAATNRSIHFANHPFFFEVRTEHDDSPLTRYLQVTVLLTLIMSLVAAYFSMFYVMESCNDYKNFQLISGVTVWVFLLVRFVCDYAIYLFMTLILILLLALFKKEGFNTIQNLSTHSTI